MNVRTRRWLLAGLFALVAAVVLIVAVRVVPGLMHGRDMEKFCTSVPEGLDRKGFTEMAEQQGYTVTPGHDAKGDFLRVDDDRSGGNYICFARFKPDGKIDSMNFTAGPKVQVK